MYYKSLSPFAALKLPFGKTTVMHLVARETLPEPNSQGKLYTRNVSYSNMWQSSRVSGFISILQQRSLVGL